MRHWIEGFIRGLLVYGAVCLVLGGVSWRAWCAAVLLRSAVVWDDA